MHLCRFAMASFLIYLTGLLTLILLSDSYFCSNAKDKIDPLISDYLRPRLDVHFCTFPNN